MNLARGGAGRASFAPLADPGLVLAYDFLRGSAGATADGVALTQLLDLGPHGYHTTQADATKRAIYRLAGLRAFAPCAEFDGINDTYITPPLTAMAGAPGFTMIIVGQTATAGAKYLAEYGASGGAAGGPSGSFAAIENITNANSLTCYLRNNLNSNFWRSNVGTEDLNTPKVLSFRGDLTAPGASEVLPIRSMAAALAGAATTTADGTGTMSSQVLAIAAQVSGANATNLKLHAIYLFNRVLSDAELLAYERALGTPAGLPFADELATRPQVRVVEAGQSNAMGQFESFAAIEAYDGPHANPLIRSYKDFRTGGVSYTTGGWVPLTENPGFGWEGPDLPIAAELLRRHRVAPEVIEVTEGATNLYNHWNPNTVGQCFDRLESTLATALSTHPAPPASPQTFFVWIQGESDAPSAEYVNYKTNLLAFIDAVRALPEMADCWFVIWKLHPSCAISGSTPASVASIRAAQDDIPNLRERVIVYETSHLTLQGDGVHYTEASGILGGKETAALIAANVS
jgi:hypothetical protein